MKPLIITTAAIFGLAALPAHAQSTEEVAGAILGGTAGAAIGEDIDDSGSEAEGQVIGAAVGGTLGYLAGDAVDGGDDDDFDDDRAIRRDRVLRDDDDDIDIDLDDDSLDVDIDDDDHPVFDHHPGRGRGKD